MNIFPFWLQCDQRMGGGEHQFREAFMANKPADLAWYGYDVFVESPDSVEFIAYEMADSVEGWIGSEICRFKVAMKVPDNFIRWRARKLAEETFRKRKAEQEEQAITSIMNAILRELTPPNSQE